MIVDDEPVCACVNNIKLNIGVRDKTKWFVVKMFDTCSGRLCNSRWWTSDFLRMRMITCNITDGNFYVVLMYEGIQLSFIFSKDVVCARYGASKWGLVQ